MGDIINHVTCYIRMCVLQRKKRETDGWVHGQMDVESLLRPVFLCF